LTLISDTEASAGKVADSRKRIDWFAWWGRRRNHRAGGGNLPSPGPSAQLSNRRAARDKHKSREILERRSTPHFGRFSAGEDPISVAGRVHFPCVVKPLFLSASRGVMRCDDPGDLARAWERLGRILKEPEVRRKGGEAADWILVEGYIPGGEVAVEGLLIHGELKVLAQFDKPDPLEGPFFEETIYVTPSRLPLETQREVLRTTALAAAALGLREGPIHAELRVNEWGRPLERSPLHRRTLFAGSALWSRLLWGATSGMPWD
jgi:biotin carboxylase